MPNILYTLISINENIKLSLKKDKELFNIFSKGIKQCKDNFVDFIVPCEDDDEMRDKWNIKRVTFDKVQIIDANAHNMMPFDPKRHFFQRYRKENRRPNEMNKLCLALGKNQKISNFDLRPCDIYDRTRLQTYN